ncbi:MAG: 2-oxo acid dehydrogenase subunit E2 [Pirellulales bacterium]
MAWIPIPGVDPRVKGRWLGLSPQRRFVCDLLHFSRAIPSVPTQRRMHLADVIEARARRSERISWCAIFIKAFGIVAAARPELRRCYLPLIWPHLYEHPINVANFSLERTYHGEPGVFFARIQRPEELSLCDLDALVRHYQSAPVETVPTFVQALRIGRLPRPLRRLIWAVGLYSDGACRGHFFGTFGISVVGSLGAAGLHILSPLTTTLNYGTFTNEGALDVRLTYDHRVLDGAPAARALRALEDVLHEIIRPELLDLAVGREPSDTGIAPQVA